MKRKYVIILVVILVLLVGGLYGYNEYNRKNVDLTGKKPDFHLNASDLIAAFDKDSASANKKYIDKVIEVNGNIKSIDTVGNPIVIALGDPGQMSSVQCSMDSTHAKDYQGLSEGDHITVKGMCTGAITEELFGTDVKLNRSVINNKK